MAIRKEQSLTNRLVQKPAPGAALWELEELVQSLALDFPILARYLGDNRLRAAALEYNTMLGASAPAVAALGGEFPSYMARAKRFSHHPEIAELAMLEQSFKPGLEPGVLGFEVVSRMTDATEIARLRLHPWAKILEFKQNTTSLWSAIKCGEAPPRAYQLDVPQQVLVWHKNHLPRFRILGDDEAEALGAFASNPSAAPPYFPGWVEAGLVVAPMGEISNK